MKRRRLLLLLCVIVVAAVVVLASSVHDVQFLPGRTLVAAAPSSYPNLMPLVQIASETPLWKLLLFWLAFVTTLVLWFYLLPPVLRKKIVRQMLGLATGFLVLLLAARYQILKLPPFIAESANPAGGFQPGPDPGSRLPIFHAPPMSAWTIYLVSLAVLLAILSSLYFIYRKWKRSQPSRLSSLTAIAGIAEASLRDLASGRNWGDVILQTYADMSNAVSARRGLQRGASATAREFADRLAHAGLPGVEVERLTRLFETVRYGGRRSSESDMKEAVDCLNTILLACGATP